MMKTLSFTLTSIAAACLVTAPVQASTKGCLSRSEAAAIMTFAMPGVVETARQKCRPHLPANNGFVQADKVIEARWKTESDAAWTKAKAAAKNIFGKDSSFLFQMMDDRALKSFAGAAISEVANQKIKPKNCGDIAFVYNELKPLPLANMSRLIVFAMEQAQNDKSGKQGKADDNGFSICPVTRAN